MNQYYFRNPQAGDRFEKNVTVATVNSVTAFSVECFTRIGNGVPWDWKTSRENYRRMAENAVEAGATFTPAERNAEVTTKLSKLAMDSLSLTAPGAILELIDHAHKMERQRNDLLTALGALIEYRDAGLIEITWTAKDGATNGLRATLDAGRDAVARARA